MLFKYKYYILESNGFQTSVLGVLFLSHLSALLRKRRESICKITRESHHPKLFFHKQLSFQGGNLLWRSSVISLEEIKKISAVSFVFQLPNTVVTSLILKSKGFQTFVLDKLFLSYISALLGKRKWSTCKITRQSMRNISNICS